MTRAGHRIIFRDPDLAGIARQVLDECRNVLPFHWFQFELLSGDSVTQTWSAGPDGQIEEGTHSRPTALQRCPGVHRRSSWKILGRELKGDSEPIARLRFWCDPRRLEATSVDLLDSLVATDRCLGSSRALGSACETGPPHRLGRSSGAGGASRKDVMLPPVRVAAAWR